MAKTNDSGERASGMENPFPGLKPYEIDDSRFYHTDQGRQAEVLSRLHSKRFVTLIGEPGSGKASFVNCSIIPALMEGFAGRGGTNWTCVSLRPGNNPIRNMANALSVSEAFKGDDRVEPNFANQLEKMLRENMHGLLEVFDKYPLKEAQNLLVFIDDLEDIFLYKKIFEKEDDRKAFINLLIKFIGRSKVPVYFIMALSSDNISESSMYPGLPELINDSQYMVSKPDALQLREFLHHAFRSAGIPYEGDLISRIVGDYKQGNANNYRLQFLLHYMVELWLEKGDAGQPISEQEYKRAGELSGAIENRAEELYEALDDQKKQIIESLLKGVTEIDQVRVTSIKEISVIVGCAVAEVIDVINTLRSAGLDFILIIQSYNVEEQLDSLKDIPEESSVHINGFSKITLRNFELVDSWKRFKNWVKEEGLQAEVYLRLVNAARLARKKERGYLMEPELGITKKWYDEQAPTVAWFHRYSDKNEDAIEFLEASIANHQMEIKEEEQRLRLKAKRGRQLKWVLISAAFVSICFAAWAYNEKLQATSDKLKMDYVQNIDAVRTKYIENLLYLDSLIDSPDTLYGNTGDSCCIKVIRSRIVDLGQATVNFRTRSMAGKVKIGNSDVFDSLHGFQLSVIGDYDALDKCCIIPLKYRGTDSELGMVGSECYPMVHCTEPQL